MYRGLSILLVVILACSLAPPASFAQYRVPVSTFTAGGGVRSGTNIVYDSAAQSVIGISSGSSYIVKSGFWYTAGLSSAVDVAITAFNCELKEDRVVLRWLLSSDNSFNGVNVYRADVVGEDVEPEFIRLNSEPLDAAGESFFEDETAFPGKSYYYKIGVLDGSTEKFSEELKVVLPPKPLTLYQNYPNPFNPSTRIAFFLPEAGIVRLNIYDTSGRVVKRLVNETRDAGRYVVEWDGRNEAGRKVNSGIYFYRLDTGKKSITKKLVMIR